LDDDNLMDPEWLRSVAWAFARWPDKDLLYGARIVEDSAARHGVPSGAMPRMEWLPYDRANLEFANYIDMNAIAHRAGLRQARFDPSLRSSIEWEMLLRLTAEHAPLELPVIACLYSNFAPNRLSDLATCSIDNNIVRSRAHTTRPMRVLCYHDPDFLQPDTDIDDEIMALHAQGASVAFAMRDHSVSHDGVRQTVFASYEEAVAAHVPDIVIVYGASHALQVLEELERAARPFALRTRSLDFDIEYVERIKAHPYCVGVWSYPCHAASVPGAHGLVPILAPPVAAPEPAVERALVAAFSAALPNDDWPHVLDAMDQITDLDRLVVLAKTNGQEHVAHEMMRQAAARARPVRVRADIPRSEISALLARASVALYTVAPDFSAGMPMSVIEGMRAGVCVITPDLPEMRTLCAAGFRPYRTAQDIVAHVRKIAAGGPHIEEERLKNQEHVLTTFCDPALGQRFHAELAAAITAWRMES